MDFALYKSPIGVITLASDADKITGLWIEGQKYHGNTACASSVNDTAIPVFITAKSWLDRYFNGEKPLPCELPLSPIGSDFRQAVWKILCEIPYGETITYGAIARIMADKQNRTSMSGQAIGGAVGHNPISIIIPCHRVVGSNGSLTGYAGGIAIKEKLLQLEKADTTSFFIPKKGTAL